MDLILFYLQKYSCWKGKTSIPVVQQNKKISGVVKDKSGEPIIGANIVVKDSKSLGTVTDMDGNFLWK